MKQKLLGFLIALLFAIEGLGQPKSVSVPVYKSGDTTGYYKILRQRIAQMKMHDPIASNYALLLRVSCENWSVEVRSINLKTISGTVYFFTRKVGTPGGNSDGEFFFKKKRMSRSKALAISQSFQKHEIASIPDQKDIRRWPFGSDGMDYLIEHKDHSTYTFKTYWEPSSSRYQVKEAAAIDDFIREIESTLELPASFLTFLNKLPRGTYHTGGITAYTNTGKKRKARK